MRGSVLRVESRGLSIRVGVHVQPRATRSEIVGVHGTALKMRVQALPVDGAANEAVVAFLAERLGLPRRSVTVVGGLSSRSKLVDIEGTSERAVRALAEREGV